MGSVASCLLKFFLEFSVGVHSLLCDLKNLWAMHCLQSGHTEVMREAITECWSLYSYRRWKTLDTLNRTLLSQFNFFVLHSHNRYFLWKQIGCEAIRTNAENYLNVITQDSTRDKRNTPNKELLAGHCWTCESRKQIKITDSHDHNKRQIMNIYLLY